MTDAVAPDAVARRRRFLKRWLIAAGIGLISLLVILIGVFLLADDTTPCACSPVPPSTRPSPS